MGLLIASSKPMFHSLSKLLSFSKCTNVHRALDLEIRKHTEHPTFPHPNMQACPPPLSLPAHLCLCRLLLLGWLQDTPRWFPLFSFHPLLDRYSPWSLAQQWGQHIPSVPFHCRILICGIPPQLVYPFPKLWTFVQLPIFSNYEYGYCSWVLWVYPHSYAL